MSTEKELASLSFAEAPKIITGSVPGPEGKKILNDSMNYESMARGAGAFPLVCDEGKGATVKDPDGNIFIDITAGVAVTSVGRCHPRVQETIKGQMTRLMHGGDWSNTKRAELAKKISSIMPDGLRDNCVTYFAQGGSGAVETAIKFARKITGRGQILAFHGDYHGVWCGSGSLTTGDQYRQGYGPFIPGVIHAPYPYCYRCCFGLEYPACKLQCAQYVNYVLNTPYTGADDVGMVIVEPLQGEGGYVVPPPGWFEIIKQACEKHGALLVADEVQAGAGRTGKMWSIEHDGIEPDMLTWGKGMGGDLPNAGVCIRKDLAQKIEESSQPNTFAGNALTAAVTLTNIEILSENEFELVKRAGLLGDKIQGWLKDGAKDLRTIGEVRGRGLMIGIEMVKDKNTREPLDGDTMGSLIMNMLKRGVVMVPCGRYGNVFRFMPSLVLTEEYAKKATDIFLETIKEVEADDN
jgi:4-aminobutyrate aminotransferase